MPLGLASHFQVDDTDYSIIFQDCRSFLVVIASKPESDMEQRIANSRVSHSKFSTWGSLDLQFQGYFQISERITAECFYRCPASINVCLGSISRAVLSYMYRHVSVKQCQGRCYKSTFNVVIATPICTFKCYVPR